MTGLKQDETGRYYFDSLSKRTYPEMPKQQPQTYMLAHIWDWDGMNPSVPRICGQLKQGCALCLS
jgi:hypothetical protein